MARLADDFFFIVHDGHTGKLQLHRRSAAIGLAGALLGELALTGNIQAASGTLTVLNQTPPEDDLAYRVLHQLTVERQYQSLRTWLQYLSQGAMDRVGVRLARDGLVRPRKTRRPWGTAVHYVPAEFTTASWPAARLNARVNRGDQLTIADSMLAALVAACGFAKHVWWDGDAVTARHLAAAVAELPISMREIVTHTEAAVGDAVLGPHM